jgi:hypothetical protein
LNHAKFALDFVGIVCAVAVIEYDGGSGAACERKSLPAVDDADDAQRRINAGLQSVRCGCKSLQYLCFCAAFNELTIDGVGCRCHSNRRASGDFSKPYISSLITASGTSRLRRRGLVNKRFSLCTVFSTVWLYHCLSFELLPYANRFS